MPHAKPSSRTTSNVTVNCGMINIPVAIFAGTEKSGVERHRWVTIDGTDRPVGNGAIDKTTGVILSDEEKAAIQLKIETTYGPVYVEDDEIEKLFDLDRDTLVVSDFQPIALRDAYVTKSVSYIEPQKSGAGAKRGYMKNATRALATFLKTMEDENVMAVGELTTRGKPKPVILMPDGRLLMLFHTEEVREQREMPEVETREGELKMMHSLVEALTTTEPLDLEDKRSALIQAFAEEKAAEGDFDKPEIDTSKAAPAEDIDEDFMAALQKSIEAAKSGKKAAS